MSKCCVDALSVGYKSAVTFTVVRSANFHRRNPADRQLISREDERLCILFCWSCEIEKLHFEKLLLCELCIFLPNLIFSCTLNFAIDWPAYSYN